MRSDRAFIIAFSVSMGLHLALLIGRLFSLDWFNGPRNRVPLQVIYEYQIAQEDELKRLQKQRSRAQRTANISPLPGNLSQQNEVRIPERPSLATETHLTELLPSRSAVVDLTNLVDAARGDPVLLSYFSAIREQIQQTANGRSWMTGEHLEGVVYISFILTQAGMIEQVAVVPQKSTSSEALQEIALRIVESASPFPAFPPSLPGSSKTIVVPLEFLRGS